MTKVKIQSQIKHQSSEHVEKAKRPRLKEVIAKSGKYMDSTERIDTPKKIYA